MKNLDKSLRSVEITHIRYSTPNLGADDYTRIVYNGGIQHLSVKISSRYLNTFQDGAYRWCTKWNEYDKYVFPDGMIEV